MDIDRLLEDVVSKNREFDISGNDYYKSYFEFIKFFSETPVITHHNLTIGINFVYGWMPTILTIHGDDLSDQIVILNNLKNKNIIPDSDAMEMLKSAFNNSIVGTSKLMHFVRPDLMPIWDSKVSAQVRKIIPMTKQVNSVNNYIKYVALCNDIIDHYLFSKAKIEIEKVVKYSITNMRAVEQLLFYNINNINDR